MNASRNPNFANYEGPTYRAGRDVPCHACDASGVIEDGEQIDVDAYRDCLCGNCDGSGIEPWRAAGDRDTSNPSRDALSYARAPRWTWDACRRRDSLRGYPLARLRMIEAAIGCDLACQSAVAAWRLAVAA